MATVIFIRYHHLWVISFFVAGPNLIFENQCFTVILLFPISKNLTTHKEHNLISVMIKKRDSPHISLLVSVGVWGGVCVCMHV